MRRGGHCLPLRYAVAMCQPVLNSLADAMCGEQGRSADHHGLADLVGSGFHAESGHVRQLAVERGHGVPEIRLRAAHTSVTRLHRPAGVLVPPQRRAVVEGAGTFAAELVQAPPIGVALITEIQRELARVEEGPPVTVIVNAVAVGEQRTAQFISGRQAAERQPVRDRRPDVVPVRRAARHVHQRHVTHQITRCHRPRGIRAGRGDPAETRARAHRDNRPSLASRLRQQVSGRAATDRARPGDISLGYGALNDQQVPGFGHRRPSSRLCLGPSCGHQDLHVIERDHPEYQACHIGVFRPQERLGTPSAVLERQPDHSRPAGHCCRRQPVRHLPGHPRRQRQHGCQPRAVVQKTPPADPMRAELRAELRREVRL